jgi:hypothetical protein
LVCFQIGSQAQLAKSCIVMVAFTQLVANNNAAVVLGTSRKKRLANVG